MMCQDCGEPEASHDLNPLTGEPTVCPVRREPIGERKLKGDY